MRQQKSDQQKRASAHAAATRALRESSPIALPGALAPAAERLGDVQEEILGLKHHLAESDNRLASIANEYAQALHEEAARILDLVAKMMALGTQVVGPQGAIGSC